MSLKIKDVKKTFPKVKTMEEYVSTLQKDEPTLILRDYEAPAKAPCFEKGVQIFDFEKSKRPKEDLESSYGTKPDVAGIKVLNAIMVAFGAGSYAIHISDSSYTGYSIWELREFMRNFDSTDLRVWIPQVFDCDDFSQVLQGNVNGFFPGIAFGTLWYGPKYPPYTWGHSVNVFYSYTDNKLYLVEPQNDVFYLFNQSLWKPWMVII